MRGCSGLTESAKPTEPGVSEGVAIRCRAQNPPYNEASVAEAAVVAGVAVFAGLDVRGFVKKRLVA